MNDELNRRAPAQPEPAALAFDASMPPEVAKWLSKHPPTNIRALQPESAAPPDASRDAYEGCREDLLDWKHRALVAEENNRQLTRALQAEVNSPTFMGEAAAPPEATLDQMANTAWDRFQSHTVVLQALENCRLYAARHRKEEWSAVIRRFCAEGGATGSPLREAAPTKPEPVAPLTHEEASAIAELLRADHDVDDLEPECCLCTAYRKLVAAPTVVEPEPVAWAGYDLDGMVEAFHRVIEAHANKNNPFHNPIDADAQMALRILRGFLPTMKTLAATPPRAALTDGDIDSATANRRDALLDHIEEYGTTSEGVRPLVRQLARAVIAADRGRG